MLLQPAAFAPDFHLFPFSGRQEAEVRGPQGAAAGHPSDAAEEEAQARPQEEEGREEQVGRDSYGLQLPYSITPTTAIDYLRYWRFI